MIEALLLVGLLALFAAWRGTAKRLAALEMRVADLNARQMDAEGAGSAVPAARLQAGSVVDTVPAPPEREPIRHAHEKQEPALVTAAEPDRDAARAEAPAFEEAPARETLGALFERFVGGRLLVWTGGIAIALAGLFLVRYSIELGLIGPRVRMIAAAVFGLALTASGEIARRRIPGDLRIGQALVGAGVLILYAAAYGSHILYGLIDLTTAFALMAAVAAGALVLSLRHGTPTAALGLVGGFLTPLLVGRSTGEAAPLLGYLALLNLAVFAVSVRSARPWLGWAAKLMTLGWTASLLADAPDDALLIGAFLLVHTIATGLAWKDEPVPSLGPTIALLQIGAVVPLVDFSPAGWGLVFAFGAAGFALAERSRVLTAVPGRALSAGLLLIPAHILFADGRSVAPYAAGIALLFASGAWWRLDRAGGRIWPTLTFCAAIAGPALLVRAGEATLLYRPGWGALLAALSLAPAVLAWRMRSSSARDAPFDRAMILAATTAAGLLVAAVPDLVPLRWIPAGWMLVALGVAAAGRKLGDGGVLRLSMVVGGAASIAAVVQAEPLWRRLIEGAFGVPVLVGGLPPVASAIILFAMPAALAFGLWRLLPRHEAGLARVAGTAASALAAVAVYILFKQLFALRTDADFVASGFAERALLTQALFFAGWLLLKRPRLPWLALPARMLTAIAAARFAWFDLVVLNPAWVAQDVGGWPGLNLLLPAYLGSAFWLLEARRRAAAGTAASIFLALFLAALIVGAGLLVRQLFQGAILTVPGMPRPEFYGYSLAGLLLSVGLLLFGWRRGDTPLRVAGLALLTATVVKVFLVDAAALEGLLRIASFLGLGVALIGMGKLYGTVLGRGGPASGDSRKAA